MTYYITWIADGFEAPLLTGVDSDTDLPIDALLAAAFDIEEIDEGTPYELCSIIRAKNADVIF